LHRYILVEQGADVNAAGVDMKGNETTPLWWAAWAVHDGAAGGLELATLLVEAGADVNSVGRAGAGASGAPLWLAALAMHDEQAGRLELAKLGESWGI
jgi:hypothetical protein